MTARVRPAAVVVASAALVVGAVLAATADAQPRRAPVVLGDGPWTSDTFEGPRIRVSVVVRGLEHPWGLAFLPDGNMLITERPGRLREIGRAHV